MRLRAGGELVAQARVAHRPSHRALGLIGTRQWQHPNGLLIPRCSAVHSFFMRFPIDLVYLTGDFEVVKVVAGLRPWRLSSGGRRASQTLELPQGEAARLRLEPGQRLEHRFSP